jgi:hypothetical protein
MDILDPRARELVDDGYADDLERTLGDLFAAMGPADARRDIGRREDEPLGLSRGMLDLLHTRAMLLAELGRIVHLIDDSEVRAEVWTFLERLHEGAATEQV